MKRFQTQRWGPGPDRKEVRLRSLLHWSGVRGWGKQRNKDSLVCTESPPLPRGSDVLYRFPGGKASVCAVVPPRLAPEPDTTKSGWAFWVKVAWSLAKFKDECRTCLLCSDASSSPKQQLRACSSGQKHQWCGKCSLLASFAPPTHHCAQLDSIPQPFSFICLFNCSKGLSCKGALNSFYPKDGPEWERQTVIAGGMEPTSL